MSDRMNDARRTSGRNAYGMIRVQYYNFSKPKGNPRRQLNRQVWYTVYGDKVVNPDQVARGFIYREDGEVETYGVYKAWTLGKSKRHPYIYRVIISPKHHILTAADFVSVVQTANRAHGFADEFRLVMHTDAPNRHAHLLLPADKTMTQTQLRAWKQTIRENLIQREQVRCVEKGMPLPRVGEEEDDYQTRRIAWQAAVARGELTREQIDVDPPDAELSVGIDTAAHPIQKLRREKNLAKTRTRRRGRSLSID